MTWLAPDRAADPGGSRGRWIYPALAYGLLGVSTGVAFHLGQLDSAAVALVALAALWVPWLYWLYPRSASHRILVVVHYAGLLAVGGALVSTSIAFTLFISIGYPLAGALFPVRGIMSAVAATAIVTVAAQSRPGSVRQIDLLTALLGIAVPLLFVGWQVGAESDRRRKTNERLKAALAENAGLHAQLVTQAREAGVLDERQRLAREIHDTIAQDLVALITQLRAADDARHDPERWRGHMDNVAALAARSLTEARRSVRALHPEPLEDARLPDALAEMAAGWGEQAGVRPGFEVTGSPRRLAAGVEVVLFRVVQEALSNIAKHARARRVGVTLSYLDDVVLLDIRDDGAGFEPGGENKGYGLDTMRQRVRGVAGTLSIESTIDQGTAVAVSVPAIPAEEAT
ncbi:sensor histidine kinase [Streptosporangium sp. KLBMP 9127]|nr:sensor histidine kinase [Streptosporangium sp. KLBMP 9127]